MIPKVSVIDKVNEDGSPSDPGIKISLNTSISRLNYYRLQQLKKYLGGTFSKHINSILDTHFEQLPEIIHKIEELNKLINC